MVVLTEQQHQARPVPATRGHAQFPRPRSVVPTPALDSIDKGESSAPATTAGIYETCGCDVTIFMRRSRIFSALALAGVGDAARESCDVRAGVATSAQAIA